MGSPSPSLLRALGLPAGRSRSAGSALTAELWQCIVARDTAKYAQKMEGIDKSSAFGKVITRASAETYERAMQIVFDGSWRCDVAERAAAVGGLVGFRMGYAAMAAELNTNGNLSCIPDEVKTLLEAECLRSPR